MQDFDDELDEIKKLIGTPTEPSRKFDPDSLFELPKPGEESQADRLPQVADLSSLFELPHGEEPGEKSVDPFEHGEEPGSPSENGKEPGEISVDPFEHGEEPGSPFEQPPGEEPGLPAKPAPKLLPGSLSLRRKPGPPFIRQLSGPGAGRKPALPQPKPASGLPALRQTPGVPSTTSSPGVPSATGSPGSPSATSSPSTPSATGNPGSPEPKARQAGLAVPARPREAEPKITLPPPRRTVTARISPPAPPPEEKAPSARHSARDADSDIDGFDIRFDFEEAYKDAPENRPLRLRRERRTGCVGGLLYSSFIICVSIVLAALMWKAAVDVLGFNADNEQVNVYIQKDFVLDDIIDILYDTGLIQYKSLFRIYAGFSNAEEKITPGSYVLNKNYDYRALVQGMTARAGVRVETTVTIPEGYTLAQIFTLLEEYSVCAAADLWEAATNYDFNYAFLDKDTLGERLRLEGYLFPETYNFYIGSTPVQAIGTFLREFEKRFTETYIERAENLGYSIHEIITVASMIEREAGSDEERSRIAAVIYNRLNSRDFPNLQIDATIRYAIAGTGIPFSIDYDHPYNTYIIVGLPPGPIANPGKASIEAALYPDSTNEYYYARNKSGTHNFFRTSAQHQAFIRSDEYDPG